MNEFLFLFSAIACLFAVVLFYRFLGKTGLFIWAAIASIVANLMTVKCVTIFGLATVAGNILYGSTYLVTDILSENYGAKDARKAVYIGALSMVVFVVITQLGLRFMPNEFDWASEHLQAIFSFMPRLCVSSIVVYTISNTIDTFLYDFIGKRTDKIWIRNNGSTCVSQLVDTILFAIYAFAGTMPFEALVQIIISTYLFKLIVAILDTPFAYIGKRIKNKHYEKEII